MPKDELITDSARVARGTALIVGGRLLGNMSQFIGTMILARLLTPADFGLVALTSAIIAVTKGITDMSLSSALIQERDITKQHIDTAFTLNAIRGALITAALIIAAPLIGYISSEPRLHLLICVMSLSILLDSFTNPRIAIATRDLSFSRQFIVQISNKLSVAALSIAFACTLHNYWAIVLGVVSGQAISTGLSYMLMPYSPQFSLSKVRNLLSFSIWLSLGQMVNQLNWRFDHIIIGMDKDKSLLGLYSMGDNIASITTREATIPLYSTLFPAFAKFSSSSADLARAYLKAQTLLTAIALPLGVGTALVAHPVIMITMGDKWSGVVLVVQVLAPAAALQTMGSLAHPLGMAAGQTKLLFKRDFQNMISRIPLIAIGMYFFGISGALYGRAISVAVENILNIYIVRHICGLGTFNQIFAGIRSYLSAAAMAAIVLNTPTQENPWAEILLKSIVGSISYISIHFVAWILSGKPQGPERELIALLHRTFQARRL